MGLLKKSATQKAVLETAVEFRKEVSGKDLLAINERSQNAPIHDRPPAARNRRVSANDFALAMLLESKVLSEAQVSALTRVHHGSPPLSLPALPSRTS